ncbi:MAG: hypothetical protein Devi2KO_28470 [Devosia indica]
MSGRQNPLTGIDNLICNQGVAGSNPAAGTTEPIEIIDLYFSILEEIAGTPGDWDAIGTPEGESTSNPYFPKNPHDFTINFPKPVVKLMVKFR